MNMIQRPLCDLRYRFKSLAHIGFRRYLISQLLLSIASWMYIIVENRLVTRFDHTGVAFGITTTLQWGPMFLLGLIGGAVADRSDRKKVILISQSFIAFITVLMCVIAQMNAMTLPIVWTATFLIGIANAFYIPSMQIIPAEFVNTGSLTNALALNGSVPGVGRMMGPAIASLMFSMFNIPETLLINFLVLLASILLLMQARTMQGIPCKPSPESFSSVFEVLGSILETKSISKMILIIAIIFPLVYHFQIFLPMICYSLPGADGTIYGHVMSIFGFGGLTSSVVLAGHAGHRNDSIALSIFALGISLLFLGFSHALWQVIISAYVLGCSSVYFSLLVIIKLQVSVQSSQKGRIMGLFAIIYLGGGVIFGPLVGLMISTIGVTSVLVLVMILCSVVASAVALTRDADLDGVSV